ncbi:hypothetical protein ACOME3_009642 [Neoechinorhynchus agilis]
MTTVIRDYEADREKIRHFLENFKSKQGDLKYIDEVKRVSVRSKRSVTIFLDDVETVDSELASFMMVNSPRYVRLFAKVIGDLIDKYKDSALEGGNIPVGRKDALDVYIETCEYLNAQRYAQRVEQERQIGGYARKPELMPSVPDELKLRFDIYFHPPSHTKRLSTRDIKSSSIGRLIWIKSIVTRISEVKPMLAVATYTCDRCGIETYQPITSPTFMPLTACPGKECMVNRTTGTLTLQSKGSKFLKFQEIRVQELSEQVPVGGIPSSLVVWCIGENTRQCKPGEIVEITGVLMPVQKNTPYKQMMQGLLTDVALVAHQLIKVNKSDDDVNIWDSQITREEISRLREEYGDDMYETLASSLAPEIYGHEDIKKALVLMLVGGVDHASKGMKIRGNINVCLMGDPGVAKSQMLSYIARLAQRSQYTTGRGSSGVGLTAAVLRDPTTNEMILEGGALVLADGGVCCIDEFDKMTETDRTAIHEVMEQQTISVAKAGILTSLNARVSILAAANPAYGRYNVQKTVAQNVQLPAALLSRFDLLWVMQDRADHDADYRLAKHIVHVHQYERQPSGDHWSLKRQPLDMVTFRKYINACKRVETSVSTDLFNFIISAYVQMREEARNERNKKIRGYTSARTLLAILRLSSAHARVRLSRSIEREDVEEAIRLMDMSKQSLVTGQEDPINQLNDVDQIFAILRELLKESIPANIERQDRSLLRTIKFDDALERVINRGFDQEQFKKAIAEYEKLDVIQITSDGRDISFV